MSPAPPQLGRTAAPGAPLGPFDPPYHFSGSALIVMGLWRSASMEPPLGFRAMRVFGWQLGVVILSDYREPPLELPLRYHELIASRLVRRRLRLCAQALDMVLDEPVPVELGQRHYDLPKRLDTSLRVVEARGSARAQNKDLAPEGQVRGADCALVWREWGALPQLLALPCRLLFALAIALFTACFDVFGAGPRPRRARIVLRPRTLGRALRVEQLAIGQLVMTPIFAARFARVATRLGVPRAFD